MHVGAANVGMRGIGRTVKQVIRLWSENGSKYRTWTRAERHRQMVAQDRLDFPGSIASNDQVKLAAAQKVKENHHEAHVGSGSWLKL